MRPNYLLANQKFQSVSGSILPIQPPCRNATAFALNFTILLRRVITKSALPSRGIRKLDQFDLGSFKLHSSFLALLNQFLELFGISVDPHALDIVEDPPQRGFSDIFARDCGDEYCSGRDTGRILWREHKRLSEGDVVDEFAVDCEKNESEKNISNEDVRIQPVSTQKIRHNSFPKSPRSSPLRSDLVLKILPVILVFLRFDITETQDIQTSLARASSGVQGKQNRERQTASDKADCLCLFQVTKKKITIKAIGAENGFIPTVINIG